MGFADKVKEEGFQGGEILTVSPFAFFDVKGKVFFDAMKLGQPQLGKAPEGLDAGDVGPAPGKRLGLVDADMAVVGVEKGSPAAEAGIQKGMLAQGIGTFDVTKSKDSSIGYG